MKHDMRTIQTVESASKLLSLIIGLLEGCHQGNGYPHGNSRRQDGRGEHVKMMRKSTPVFLPPASVSSIRMSCFKNVCFRVATALMILFGALNGLQAQPGSTGIRWSASILNRDAVWYASDAAKAVADSVIQYQSSQGGWPKSTNLAIPPRTPDDIPSAGSGRANTLDNGATTLPMAFLAKVTHATGEKRYEDSFVKGVEYLLAAQYPNGGWPQFWPLRDGYYSRITFNDGAMIRAISILRDVAGGTAPYSFITIDLQQRAASAVDRGIDCILRTQVKVGGVLTVWCAQHDEVTLEPASARSYELVSLSGSESAGVLLFLMSIENPSPEVIRAVKAGVAWFEAVRIEGYEYRRSRNGPAIVPNPDARPLWARFYEIGTNRPFFSGRDGVKRYDIMEIGEERRRGYSWYSSAGLNVLRAYDRWEYR